jgi:hypothetical protein
MLCPAHMLGVMYAVRPMQTGAPLPLSCHPEPGRISGRCEGSAFHFFLSDPSRFVPFQLTARASGATIRTNFHARRRSA